MGRNFYFTSLLKTTNRLSPIKVFVFSLILINFFSCDHQRNRKPIEPLDLSENKENNFVLKLQEGETLFKTHCRSCHSAPGVLVKDGTDWNSIYARAPKGAEYILEFICSSSRLRKNADKYALRIKAENGSVKYEHEFAASLSKEELLALMVYLNEGVKKEDV